MSRPSLTAQNGIFVFGVYVLSSRVIDCISFHGFVSCNNSFTSYLSFSRKCISGAILWFIFFFFAKITYVAWFSTKYGYLYENSSSVILSNSQLGRGSGGSQDNSRCLSGMLTLTHPVQLVPREDHVGNTTWLPHISFHQWQAHM